MTKEIAGNRVLRLTLKKKWFDMIFSGEKKEEYREYKGYWINRFQFHINREQDGYWEEVIYNVPDQIVFVNGYGSHRPTMTVECLGMALFTSEHPEWGGDTENNQFILKLGNIISAKNVPQIDHYNHND